MITVYQIIKNDTVKGKKSTVMNIHNRVNNEKRNIKKTNMMSIHKQIKKIKPLFKEFG